MSQVGEACAGLTLIMLMKLGKIQNLVSFGILSNITQLCVMQYSNVKQNLRWLLFRSSIGQLNCCIVLFSVSNVAEVRAFATVILIVLRNQGFLSITSSILLSNNYTSSSY